MSKDTCLITNLTSPWLLSKAGGGAPRAPQEAQQRKTSNQLRSYNAPVINFDAQIYMELTDVRTRETVAWSLPLLVRSARSG